MRSVKHSTHNHYLLTDDTFYASLDRYTPTSELLEIVKTNVVNGSINPKGIWCSVNYYHINIKQGWKIHVSATLKNYKDILKVVSNYCENKKINYKYNSDTSMFLYMNSKTTNRGNCGKFITIYPQDDSHFLTVIEDLYKELRTFDGPYILSDKRYKDCRVLYYRYGEFIGLRELNFKNEFDSFIFNIYGEKVKEIRKPYFSLPKGINNIIEEENEGTTESDEAILLNNRYEVRKALHLSSSGGVYLANDINSDEKVILKEARPYTSINFPGIDAIQLQQNEYEKLSYLNSKSNNTPEVYGIFKQWEHSYLVLENIEGIDLGTFITSKNPLLGFNMNEKKISKYNVELKKIWINLIKGIKELGDLGVTLNDLSPANVIIKNDNSVILIDFENATYEDEASLGIETVGFRNYKKSSRFEQLSYLLFASIFPVTAILENDCTKFTDFLDYLRSEGVISEEAANFIYQLHYANTLDDEFINNIEDITNIIKVKPKGYHPSEINLSQLIRKVSSPLLSYNYDNSIFPGDILAYETNVSNLAYGVSGLFYALNSIGISTNENQFFELLTNTKLTHINGNLITGASGIALSLYSGNHIEEASEFLSHAQCHHLNEHSLDLSYGLAGIGLTSLKAYKLTLEKNHLNYSIECAYKIIKKFNESEQNYPPINQNGEKFIGLGAGYLGISLFLYYIAEETGVKKFHEVAEELITISLDKLEYTDGKILGFIRGDISKEESVYSPYIYDGLAGLGAVLIRINYQKYKKLIKEIAYSILGNLTAQTSYMRGISGIGDFLLDYYILSGDENIKEELTRICRFISTFLISDKYLPGEQLYRNSFDLFTGSAGVLLFLTRLNEIQKDNLALNKNPFFLDDYYGIFSKFNTKTLVTQISNDSTFE